MIRVERSVINGVSIHICYIFVSGLFHCQAAERRARSPFVADVPIRASCSCRRQVAAARLERTAVNRYCQTFPNLSTN